MRHRFVLFLLFVATIIFILFQVSIWGYVALTTVYLTILAIGVADIQTNYFVKSFSQKKTKIKEVALTFDDGPTPFTPLFLDELKKHNIQATFFCIGKQIEKHPEILARIIADGHSIGNHTYSHSNSIGYLPSKKVADEIHECDKILLENGIQTNFYRPPFGITNPHIAKAIRKTNKNVIAWNVRSLDTAINSEDKILKRITSRLQPGSIILMHDTSEKSLRVLVDLLLFLQNNGFSTYKITEETIRNHDQ